MSSPKRSSLNKTTIITFRSFVAVAETQSFSIAARQLRLAPSSVTKHVRLLEEAVNVALLHRTTRRVSMTDAGHRFYERCAAILAEIDNAAAVIVEERKLTGHLRITTPPSFATTVLAPHLHLFLGEHPAMSIDVMVTSATPNLIRDRIDVAISLQSTPQTKLHHVALAPCPRVLCASPTYLAAHGHPESPDDLESHECLAARFSEQAETWYFKRRRDWQPVGIRSRLLSDNGELLRQACLNGAGIGNFYRFHVAGDLERGDLVEILSDQPPRPKNIYAVLPHRQIVRPQAQAFIDFARGLLAPESRK